MQLKRITFAISSSHGHKDLAMMYSEIIGLLSRGGISFETTRMAGRHTTALQQTDPTTTTTTLYNNT